MTGPKEMISSAVPERIKVLQLGSPTGLYGAERWILALIKHLDPEKIRVSVAAIKDSSHLDAPLCVEAAKLGFPSHVIESFGRVNVSAVRNMRQLILQNRINILHTHGYKTDMVGLLATRGTACRNVTTPHGWSNQPDFKLWCYEALDRCVYPFFDAVVPLSEDMYEGLRRIPGIKGKLRLIRNGVDIDEIDDDTTVAEDIASWRKDGNIVIGFIGRLIPGKGVDVLLEAAARYGDPAWRLAIIGEGDFHRELKALAERFDIANRVTFFGFRRDRIALLKGFDVFVLPSRSEGTPRSLMEAMAAGIPVVASDIPGCRNLVEHDKTGLLFPRDDARELAQSITRIVSDATFRHELCRNGHAVVNGRFSAATMAQEYTELFLDMAAMGTRRGFGEEKK